jgi:hypothetical protein
MDARWNIGPASPDIVFCRRNLACVLATQRLRADYVEEVDEGQRTAALWIDHAAVKDLVRTRRAEICEPVNWLSRTIRVAPGARRYAVFVGFTMAALGVGTREPRSASAVVGIRDALNRLQGSDATEAQKRLHDLVAGLRGLAVDLRLAGVAIEPRFDPDLALLAELCSVEIWEDLDRSALRYPGTTTFSPDGMSARSRHVSSRKPSRVGRLQRALFESDPEFEDLRTSAQMGRIGGLKGAEEKRAQTSVRIDALRVVLSSHGLPPSDRSAAKVIWETWGRRDAGKMMSELTGIQSPPSESTLAKAIAKARNLNH